MKTINRVYPLTVFLAMILFSQASNAIIITSYTGFFEDGSKLVVDLKGYDYGVGSYYASPIDWDEPPFPPIEGFETVFYPSWALQNIIGGGTSSKKIENWGLSASPYFTGLHFTVDEYYGVSMTSLEYLFSAESWSISDSGIHLQYENYHTEFSGGFFKTYTSPYQVDEPGALALIFIGIAGLGWARLRRKSERHGSAQTSQFSHSYNNTIQIRTLSA